MKEPGKYISQQYNVCPEEGKIGKRNFRKNKWIKMLQFSIINNKTHNFMKNLYLKSLKIRMII